MPQSIPSIPPHALADQQAALEAQPPTTAAPAFPVPNPTVSFWQKNIDVSPKPAHGSEGPLTTDADICIIGSGISGVSTAYHLAKIFAQDGSQKPIKAVILEARDFCSGATGRNGGHLSAVAHEDFVEKQHLHGTEEALREANIQLHAVDEIVKIVKDAGKDADLDLVPGGHLSLFFTDEEYTAAKADYAAAEAAGLDLRSVEWLCKEDVQARYGAPFPAMWVKGNNIWPLKTVGLLYTLAQKMSPAFALALHTRTPATAVTPGDSARRWTVETPRGKVSCSYVLHATNAYVSYLLPHLHGPDGVIPTRGQVIATRASAPADAVTKAAWAGNGGFEYWFPRPVEANETAPLVILGGAREAAHPKYEIYEVDDSKLNPAVSRALRNFLPSVFPGMYEPGREPEVEWSGIMGLTRSGDPFVGPVVDPADKERYKGQYLSVGFSGNGMVRAFPCAEAIAGMIASDIIGNPWNAPEWLPLHYLTRK